MKIDEEFKNLIPKLSNEELKQLEENIIEEGCREPIVLWNNTIVDGHNRYEICNRNNIEFKTTNKEFSNREEAKMWIIKNQFGRRNLSIYDRGKLALKLDDLFAVKAKQNQGTRTDIFQKTEKSQEQEEIIEPINTTKELANIAGVSIDTMSKIKKIEKKAPEEVKEKVKKGEMSINQAYGYAKTYEYLENEIKDEIPKEKTAEEKYVEEEFRKIEKQRTIQKNIHNAIYKILCTDITEEYLEVWYEGLDRLELETLDKDIERAIEEYQNIKEFIKEKRKIRRIK